MPWINVAELGLQDPIAHFETHGIGLSEGRFFAAPPRAYVRLNFGCPESTLQEGLRRLRAGIAAATTAR